MSLAPIEQFPTAQALSMLSQAEGWACFIPNGYVPVLVNEDDFSDFNEEVAGGMRRIASHLVIPTALEDCRLPSLVVGNVLADHNSPHQAFAHAQPAKPPRRPANSFILYRQSRQAGLIAAYPGISNNEVSRILGQMWKNEDPQTKQVKSAASIGGKLTQQFYQSIAEDLKMQHKILYPDYKYCPKRPRLKQDWQAEKNGNSTCACSNSVTTEGPIA